MRSQARDFGSAAKTTLFASDVENGRERLFQHPVRWFTHQGPVAEYVRTFLEWRIAYGMADACMDELRAAVLAENEKSSLTSDERAQLLALADLISAERHAYSERAA